MGVDMIHSALSQFIALSLYVTFMGFTFCDGFKLHILRKLVWFTVFIAIAIYVFKTAGEFSLPLILPFPTLLAIALCAYEKYKAKSRGGTS